MAVELHRPRDIRIGLSRSEAPAERRNSTAAIALDVILRGLLVGIGIGVLLMTAHTGIASVTVLGILALGAALFGWEQ
jgi:hypothetical protein